MIARVAAVSDEILHPVSEEQVLSTVANCGSGREMTVDAKLYVLKICDADMIAHVLRPTRWSREAILCGAQAREMALTNTWENHRF
jgi:hypothetical protein